ncbi:hypothetical protein JKF63_06088 [Porcisia hertigi]|uniref:Ecotin n=1 Tax=Porcisia hertigi TaxID=2761500 RepID=A0A836IYI0_9TRYP|nr:hypothetical protein JKF63_06088 [Porcisia hertigi]
MLDIDGDHMPYPAAAPGQVRKIIRLPQQDLALEQNHLYVQIIPGRPEHCEDGCLYRLTRTVSEETVPGSGYPYYVVALGDTRTVDHTPMNKEHAATFVALHDKLVIPYNSKLPIVVYAPEGYEVRYRIWGDNVSRIKGIEQQSKALTLQPLPPVPVRRTQETPGEQEHPSDMPDTMPPVRKEGAEKTPMAQPLQTSELEDCACQVTEDLEAHPNGSSRSSLEKPVKEFLVPEQRDTISSAPLKQISVESPSSGVWLSATEISPKTNSKMERRGAVEQQSRSTTGTSKKSRSGSATSKKEDNSYEKKAKQFWNRIRTNS